MKASPAGRAAIFGFEGCRKQAYPDTGGVPTIGVGHTRGVKLGQTCTDAQAQVWFSEDLEDAEAAVDHLVKVPLTQGQYDALVDFVFEFGATKFSQSTLLKYLNQGNYTAAASQIKLWCHGEVNGQMVILPGLVKRRAWDTDTFSKDTKPAG